MPYLVKCALGGIALGALGGLTTLLTLAYLGLLAWR